MIDAVIFDLDGTLLQTEKLKAQSYARAAVELCPYTLSEDTVIEAFKDVVGKSRRDVAMYLVEKFDLEDRARRFMDKHGVSTPWQAYIQVRLKIYHEMLDNPDTLRNNQWPFNVELLDCVREWGCKTALATMSHCEQVEKILQILGWEDKFSFVATRDDVSNGKPDPEIYLMVANEFNARPEHTLVIEDSPAGVQAAINAGMEVIAVATPFTEDRLREMETLDEQSIVTDTSQVVATVLQRFSAHDQE